MKKTTNLSADDQQKNMIFLICFAIFLMSFALVVLSLTTFAVTQTCF